MMSINGKLLLRKIYQFVDGFTDRSFTITDCHELGAQAGISEADASREFQLLERDGYVAAFTMVKYTITADGVAAVEKQLAGPMGQRLED